MMVPFDGIIVLEVKRESYGILKISWIGRSILVGSLVGSLIVTAFVHANFMRYILFFAPRKRPINILIMIDQVTVLLPYVIMSLMTTVSIALGETISELAGDQICLAFWLCAVLVTCFKVYGSSGIALYRMIMVKFGPGKLGRQRLMWLILLLQNIIMISIIVIYYEGYKHFNTGSAPSFCLDRTLTFSRILAAYEHGLGDQDLAGSVQIQSVAAMVTILVGFLELSSYAIVVHHSYRHNLHMPLGLVSPDIIKKRNQSNVVTMGGQCLVFAGNLIVLLFVIASLNMPIFSNGIDEAASGVFVLMITEGVNSLVLLYSSPEMRNFLFD